MKKRLRLSNLTSYSKGQQINGDELLVDGEYDYLNGGICPSGTWNDFNTEANSIAISEGGNSCGFVNFMVKPFWCGAHCYFLHNTEGIPKYLYYALKSQQERLMKIRSGACMPNIKKAALGKFELFYDDDLDEQNKIVEVLENTEKVIEKRKKELIALDSIVQARFVEMFGSYPINQKGWDIVRIRDVVKEVKYGTSRPATQAGKYPYLRMNNITYNGELELSDIKYIDVPKTELSNCTVQYGDVLFNRTNSKELVGKTCVYNQNNMMVLAGFIIRIRVNERVLPQFLSTYLNTDFSKKMLAAMCKTAIGQANINAQELQNICIYVPPIKLQEEFVKFKKQTDKSKLTK